MTNNKPVYTWQNKPSHLQTSSHLGKMGLKVMKGQSVAAYVSYKHFYKCYDIRHCGAKRTQTTAQQAEVRAIKVDYNTKLLSEWLFESKAVDWTIDAALETLGIDAHDIDFPQMGMAPCGGCGRWMPAPHECSGGTG